MSILKYFRYPLFKNTLPLIVEGVNDSIEAKSLRSKCFFDLEIITRDSVKIKLGRIVFELYNDYLPHICANFQAFCKGTHKKLNE